MTIDELLKTVRDRSASDLHLPVAAAPTLRIDGELHSLGGAALDNESIEKPVFSMLNTEQRRRYDENSELDAAIDVKGVGRFRLNIFRQRGHIGAALRLIPDAFKSFEELGLPATIYEIAKLPNGLVLLTGPTGSGKSTTLASLINHINENRTGHIITIEDPIEYLHQHKRCLINQREVGQDTQTFTTALRHILRQDPDIILIGEMRDLETIQAALNIAETGHLVFATLHTNDTVQSINRIIDAFPANQQAQIRVQLSFVIQYVFTQQLLPHASGNGRAMACEVLMATPAIRNLIRESKAEQIRALIQTGIKHGMQTMDMSLAQLYHKNKITYECALEHSATPEDLKKLLDQKNLLKK